MFWCDWGAIPRIERAGMDGSTRRIIVKDEVRWPNGLTIDLALDKLYWVDAKLHTIGSSNLDGSGATTVLFSTRHLRHPFSISVFSHLVFWTEWGTHAIYQANKFTGANISAITNTHSVGGTPTIYSVTLYPYSPQIHLPMVVQVYHPYRQPDYPNHCLPFNGFCSHFCLPVPAVQPEVIRTVCKCPQIMYMGKDNRTCRKGGKFFCHAIHTVKTQKPNKY